MFVQRAFRSSAHPFTAGAFYDDRLTMVPILPIWSSIYYKMLEKKTFLLRDGAVKSPVKVASLLLVFFYDRIFFVAMVDFANYA